MRVGDRTGVTVRMDRTALVAATAITLEAAAAALGTPATMLPLEALPATEVTGRIGMLDRSGICSGKFTITSTPSGPIVRITEAPVMRAVGTVRMARERATAAQATPLTATVVAVLTAAVVERAAGTVLPATPPAITV